jgi:hypothetical protein
MLPFNQVLHEEAHVKGLSLRHDTLLCTVVNQAIRGHFGALRLEANPIDYVLVLATLADLTHLVIVDLSLKYVERWLLLITLGLDLHIFCHRLYRHLLNPLGDLPSELPLPPIFIYVSGMHRVHDLKLRKHVNRTNPGVR